MLEELEVRVGAFWTERIKKGDPLVNKTQKERVVESFYLYYRRKVEGREGS